MRPPVNFGRAQEASVAVEFGLIMPVVIALTVGGCATAEYVVAQRKVALACHSLVDLTSRYTTIGSSDMSDILAASTNVLAPLPVSGVKLRLSSITTDDSGLFARVAWSKGSNATALVQNSAYDLPASMRVPNTSYVLGEITYSFTPPIAYGNWGPINTTAKLFMTPRSVGSISYTGS